mmetsp:Transcript_19990/g.56177  ORF Transcript_19990/g.56177 Transcript_19990/m.56177 type:complete len:140 (+) Transcript_19990:189-608(+)
MQIRVVPFFILRKGRPYVGLYALAVLVVLVLGCGLLAISFSILFPFRIFRYARMIQWRYRRWQRGQSMQTHDEDGKPCFHEDDFWEGYDGRSYISDSEGYVHDITDILDETSEEMRREAKRTAKRRRGQQSSSSSKGRV